MTRTPKLRFLSALLAVAMMLTFLPTGVVTVFAADTPAPVEVKICVETNDNKSEEKTFIAADGTIGNETSQYWEYDATEKKLTLKSDKWYTDFRFVGGAVPEDITVIVTRTGDYYATIRGGTFMGKVVNYGCINDNYMHKDEGNAKFYNEVDNEGTDAVIWTGNFYKKIVNKGTIKSYSSNPAYVYSGCEVINCTGAIIDGEGVYFYNGSSLVNEEGGKIKNGYFATKDVTVENWNDVSKGVFAIEPDGINSLHIRLERNGKLRGMNKADPNSGVFQNECWDVGQVEVYFGAEQSVYVNNKGFVYWITEEDKKIDKRLAGFCNWTEPKAAGSVTLSSWYKVRRLLFENGIPVENTNPGTEELKDEYDNTEHKKCGWDYNDTSKTLTIEQNYWAADYQGNPLFKGKNIQVKVINNGRAKGGVYTIEPEGIQTQKVTATSGAKINGMEASTVYAAEGESITVAVPEGMQFDHWDITGTNYTEDSSTHAVTFTMPSTPVSLTAIAAKKDPSADDFTVKVDGTELTTGANVKKEYNGSEVGATVTPVTGSGIADNGFKVKYFDTSKTDDPGTETPPTKPGNYKVKIEVTGTDTVNEKTVESDDWTFTISKAAPDASDFTFTAPSDLTYDSTAKTATVEVKTGIDGMGSVSLKYFDEDGNPLQGTPKNAGTYTVKIDVAEGDNYKAANDLTDTAWKFTISKADLTKDDFELKSGNVSLKERIDGAGTVKTTYKRLDENGQPTGDDLDALPTDDGGVYQIYVTTKGGSNYNDLTTPTTDTSWTIRQDGKDRDLKGEGFVAKVNGTESKTAKWGQTVEIEPGEVPTGKKFKEWKIDGATLTDPDTTEKNSFVMGNSDVTITAVYEDIEYTLTVGGKTEKHLYNETVTLKDTPEAGMELDYWEVDGNKITGSTFPMPAKNVTAEAVYKAKSYTLTVDGKTEDHLYGSDVSVTAPAKDGYKFTGWTVEGVDVADKTSETLKFQMPAGNVTLTPSYEKIQTPVKPNPGEGEDPGSKPADPKPGKPETEKKTLTAEDFVFTAPSDNTADGTAKEASVSAKVDGAGKITLKYYDEAGNLLDKAPTDPGSYTVRVDVAESDTCKALKDLTAPGWKFTIEKAKPVTSEISIDNGKAYLEDGETEINTAEAGQTVVVRVNPEAITEGFAFDKWEVVSGGITLEDETSPEIRFVMPAGKVELKATVKVKQTPSTALSPLEQAAATTAEVVVVGAGVAALGVSVGHIATELYLKWVLPAGIIPANREQLALLLWNKENQPAADSTELYTDISADDTDAQTAAHWVIESGLMDLVDGDEADVFEPEKPVTVYEVAAAWNKKPAQSR